jgi:hypothetical protein
VVSASLAASDGGGGGYMLCVSPAGVIKGESRRSRKPEDRVEGGADEDRTTFPQLICSANGNRGSFVVRRFARV